MNIINIARISGVSVRTLHHYDSIGLLKPSRNLENSYREYSDDDVDKLQQILFLKQCGFPLKKIKDLLDSPEFDKFAAYELQRKFLECERDKINEMLITLEKTVRHAKGELIMTNNEKFKGFDFSKNPYEQEARELWGDEVVDKSNEFVKNSDQQALENIMNDLFIDLNKVKDEKPDSEAAQTAIDRMFKIFNTSFGVTYTLEAFADIGRMYVEDERFTQNIDRYGEGLAEFLSEAMQIYAVNNI